MNIVFALGLLFGASSAHAVSFDKEKVLHHAMEVQAKTLSMQDMAGGFHKRFHEVVKNLKRKEGIPSDIARGKKAERSLVLSPTEAYDICSIQACRHDIDDSGGCCTGSYCDSSNGICYTDVSTIILAFRFPLHISRVMPFLPLSSLVIAYRLAVPTCTPMTTRTLMSECGVLMHLASSMTGAMIMHLSLAWQRRRRPTPITMVIHSLQVVKMMTMMTYQSVWILAT